MTLDLDEILDWSFNNVHAMDNLLIYISVLILRQEAIIFVLQALKLLDCRIAYLFYLVLKFWVS